VIFPNNDGTVKHTQGKLNKSGQVVHTHVPATVDARGQWLRVSDS